MNTNKPLDAENAPRRGRKPLGDAPMTHAECQRRYRARKAAEGSAEFTIRIRGGMLDFIDRFAVAGGNSRSQVVEYLLDEAIAKMGNTIAEAEYMFAEGATDEEVQAFMSESLRSAPPPHLVQKYKEVMGIK